MRFMKNLINNFFYFSPLQKITITGAQKHVFMSKVVRHSIGKIMGIDFCNVSIADIPQAPLNIVKLFGPTFCPQLPQYNGMVQ